MFTQEFLDKIERHLYFRRKSKIQILQNGGEQSLSHSHRDISRINFALKRLEQKQYGLCTNCGCIINMQRLEIIPETPFCTQCANEKESH